MSLKSRIKQLARETANEAIQGLLGQSYSQQTVATSSNFGKITKADGVNLTVTMPDGTTQNVIAASGRICRY